VVRRGGELAPAAPASAACNPEDRIAAIRFSSLLATPVAGALFDPLAHEGAPQLSREISMDDDIARASRAKKGSPFLSTEQAAFYLGLSARKLQQMRAAATGPAFRRHGRYIRYHIDDLDVWSRESGAPVSRHG
jgi:hypothetical protein